MGDTNAGVYGDVCDYKEAVVASASPSSGRVAVIATTLVITVSLLALFRVTLYPSSRPIIPSPRKTIMLRMLEAQRLALFYHSDSLPGARDVETPYGSIRVYEWGPEIGPRVLLMHGISTPCITLSKIAHGLVDRGCRVMLFDFFGRGLSDGVGDLPHDARLYVTQALLALASSPLSWTGDGALHIVGYSMGGAVAVHLAAAFPKLVAQLALIAPAGMIRTSNFGITRHIFRSGLVPGRLLALITRRLLQSSIENALANRREASAATVEASVVAAAAPLNVAAASGEAADLALEYGDTVAPMQTQSREYSRWMLDAHGGYLSAFMSAAQYGPLSDQQEVWRSLARRPQGTTVVVLGSDDKLVVPAQYVEDALPLAGGKDHVRWTVIPGGMHDLPMTHADEILRELTSLWKPLT